LTFSSLNDIIKSTHAIDAKGGRLPIGIPGRLQIGMHGRLRRYPHTRLWPSTPLLPAHMRAAPLKSSETRAILLLISDDSERGRGLFGLGTTTREARAKGRRKRAHILVIPRKENNNLAVATRRSAIGPSLVNTSKIFDTNHCRFYLLAGCVPGLTLSFLLLRTA
jgi:hypothetical protein